MRRISNINEFWGAVIRRDMSSAIREEDKFHNKEELQGYLKKEIKKQGKNVIIKNLDVSGIEDLSYLFYDLLDGVETLDLSGWNTKGVKNMSHMFCWNHIKSIDMSGWDTDDVKNMSYMFFYCTMLESLDISNWNTPSLKNLRRMFAECWRLKELNLFNKNISNVDTTDGMFEGCWVLESLDLSGWENRSILYSDHMFENCPAPYEIINYRIVRK